MKKLLALLFALTLVFALSACKDDVKTEDSTSHTHTSQPQSIPSQPNANNIEQPDISIPLNSGKITGNTAIKVALAHAGVSKSDALDLAVELEAGVYWEVDFEYDGYEYSYLIESTTGTIVNFEKEKD